VTAFLSFAGVETVYALNSINITIIYDNHPHKEGFTPQNGFSCVIKAAEKTILFDTGGEDHIFLANLNKAGIKPQDVDLIVISHEHEDHTGGLLSFLKLNNKPLVFLPDPFPASLIQQIQYYYGRYVSVSQSRMICRDVYVTGRMGKQPREQAIVIDISGSLVIITGCAHPGIVTIVKETIMMFKKPVYLVLGGFHLKDASDTAIQEIITQFMKWGVKKVGAAHCTGDRAVHMFKRSYGRNYIPIGVGKVGTIGVRKRSRAKSLRK
jgi:7,8-dihydropterin-6-yl-methyl-4-(beta-D-ribofuranosyl)aminobenzene 5'-phosphate synthase